MKMTYELFKINGRLRRMINKSYNSGVITPELKDFLRWRLHIESEFHPSIWMEENLRGLTSLILQTKSKRKRFEKLVNKFNELTCHPLPKIEAAIEDVVEDKGKWRPEVLFHEPFEKIEFSDGYGCIRKATKETSFSRIIHLELDEYDNDGTPTGKTILVSYDTKTHARIHYGYKPEEEIRSYYGEEKYDPSDVRSLLHTPIGDRINQMYLMHN